MSSIEFACIRTKRDTFTGRRVRMFVIMSPRASFPWYIRKYLSITQPPIAYVNWPYLFSSSLNASATMLSFTLFDSVTFFSF